MAGHIHSCYSGKVYRTDERNDKNGSAGSGCRAVADGWLCPEQPPLADDGRLQIVCTTFPQYDWTRSLIQGNEENVSVTLLMDKGGDLHNFQPSAMDIARVSACDLFIYVGGV